MERFDRQKQAHVENQDVDNFLRDVIAVCQKHGFSLAHEDSQGAFIVESYDEGNIEWLNAASMDLRK